MKKTSRCSRLPVLLTGILLLMSVLSLVAVTVADTGRDVESRQYSSHSPILIATDVGFTQANGVIGGTGTQNDPYVISGWDISATDQNAITITGTTKYFEVSDCKLSASGAGYSGVSLSNLGHAEIRASNLQDSDHGVNLQNVQNSDIVANNLDNNDYGISIQNSQSIEVEDNIISSGDYGISLQMTDDATVSQNDITGSGYAMAVQDSDNNLIDDNDMENGDYGVSLQDSEGNTITHNDISNFGTYGIAAQNTMNNVIHHNNFLGNGGTKQATADSNGDDWDDGGEGNHWDDWTSPDADSNGIVDEPYVLAGGFAQDNYPLVKKAGGSLPLAVSTSADKNSGQAPLKVSFTSNVTGGKDPYNYSWDFDDGTEGYGPSVSHEYMSAGTYSVTLTVIDDIGTSKKSTPLEITVTAPPPLTVSASANPTTGMEDIEVSFTSSASGGIAPYTFEWDFGDSETGTGQFTSHVYRSTGIFTATLSVTDDVNNTVVSDPITIEIVQVLQVSISADPKKGDAPLKVDFDSDVSGGKAPYNYSWDFKDGETSNEANPTHKFKDWGEHDVELTVTDASGQETTETIKIKSVKNIDTSPGFEVTLFILGTVVVFILLARRRSEDGGR